MEGLSTLLKRAKTDGELQGIKVCQGAPSIHHLFFVDDSFLFVRGTVGECLKIIQLLHLYEKASS